MSKEEFDKIAETICDKYCKYPCTWDEDAEGLTLMDAVCIHCPLNEVSI